MQSWSARTSFWACCLMKQDMKIFVSNRLLDFTDRLFYGVCKGLSCIVIDFQKEKWLMLQAIFSCLLFCKLSIFNENLGF